MKKILMILLASFALASCGDGSKNSEANREDGYENTEPSVTDDNATTDDMNQGTTSDTTNTTMGDTTATAPQATPAP